MFDQLIALLNQKCETNNIIEIAEYLLENGVTVLPCKLGATVYLIPKYNGKPYCGVVKDKVQMIGITSRGIHIKAQQHHDHNKTYILGKTAFLNETEAETTYNKLSGAQN